MFYVSTTNSLFIKYQNFTSFSLLDYFRVRFYIILLFSDFQRFSKFVSRDNNVKSDTTFKTLKCFQDNFGDLQLQLSIDDNFVALREILEELQCELPQINIVSNARVGVTLKLL